MNKRDIHIAALEWCAQCLYAESDASEVLQDDFGEENAEKVLEEMLQIAATLERRAERLRARNKEKK